MRMREAFLATIRLAEERNMNTVKIAEPSLSLAHMYGMYDRITDDFSEGKLGRWLGWAQAALVAAGCATLDEMKDLNRRYSDDTE